MTAALHGFAACLGLIVAIGSQNVFVLRQGMRREHVLPVIAVCVASDAVLIGAGASGLGSLVRSHPEVVGAARWAGAAFLTGYALLAARRAVKGGGSLRSDGGADADPGARAVRGTGRGAVIAAALALTWLNPHVYLDAVLLLGSIAATHGAQAPLFAVGAVAGSALWFTALGLGARRLGRVLSSPRAWRVLDGVVAATMLGVAAMLALG